MAKRKVRRQLVAMVNKEGTEELGPMPELPDKNDDAAWENTPELDAWIEKLIQLATQSVEEVESGEVEPIEVPPPPAVD